MRLSLSVLLVLSLLVSCARRDTECHEDQKSTGMLPVPVIAIDPVEGSVWHGVLTGTVRFRFEAPGNYTWDEYDLDPIPTVGSKHRHDGRDYTVYRVVEQSEGLYTVDVTPVK